MRSLIGFTYEGRLEELVLKREFDTLFPLLGIPVCFREREVNLLSGVNALCCSREELMRLLEKGLILDGAAAGYLCRRGLGRYIGCEDVGAELRSPSAELLCGEEFHGSFSGNLLPTDWMRLEYKKIRIPLFQYDPDCEVLTVYVDKDRKVLGQGIVLYENRLGGRVCVKGDLSRTCGRQSQYCTVLLFRQRDGGRPSCTVKYGAGCADGMPSQEC